MRKHCKKCGARKAVSKFPRHRTTFDGLSPWCKECHNASVREWRRLNPPAPKAPKPLLTDDQIELVRLISKGYTTPGLAKEVGIHPEALKKRVRRIKFLLGVRRMQQIPYAYWQKTGLIPFESTGFEGRTGTALGKVVEEMFNGKEET